MPSAPYCHASMSHLPEGTSVEIGFDSTVFIDRSIRNVFTTILEAVVPGD